MEFLTVIRITVITTGMRETAVDPACRDSAAMNQSNKGFPLLDFQVGIPRA